MESRTVFMTCLLVAAISSFALSFPLTKGMQGTPCLEDYQCDNTTTKSIVTPFINQTYCCPLGDNAISFNITNPAFSYVRTFYYEAGDVTDDTVDPNDNTRKRRDADGQDGVINIECSCLTLGADDVNAALKDVRDAFREAAQSVANSVADTLEGILN